MKAITCTIIGIIAVIGVFMLVPDDAFAQVPDINPIEDQNVRVEIIDCFDYYQGVFSSSAGSTSTHADITNNGSLPLESVVIAADISLCTANSLMCILIQHHVRESGIETACGCHDKWTAKSHGNQASNSVCYWQLKTHHIRRGMLRMPMPIEEVKN